VSEGFDYRRMVLEASAGVVRSVLEQVAAEGLPGEHHLFLTFATRYPGVALPPTLALQFPETLTIVLQNQFWGLEVDEERLRVVLRFGSQPTQLTIPFAALTAFVDPHASFGLSLTPAGSEEPSPEAAAEPEPGTPLPEGGNVVAFRRPAKKS
jgi:hypothetical protein